MPHTYSLQNVPSYVAAGEAHYHQLLAGAAEARRFVPERTRHAGGWRTVGAVLRRATGSSLFASACGSRAWRYRRQRIETQLANVRTMFELGDLSKEEYVERREQLMRQRDGLRETDEWEAILAQAAAFLSDLPAAWRAADDAQRNALARMLFVQIRIKDDWVAAVEPQPSFAPFFSWDCQVRRLSGGSDGDRIRTFRTFTEGSVGCRCSTSALLPQMSRGGHRGVTLLASVSRPCSQADSRARGGDSRPCGDQEPAVAGR